MSDGTEGDAGESTRPVRSGDLAPTAELPEYQRTTGYAVGSAAPPSPVHPAAEPTEQLPQQPDSESGRGSRGLRRLLTFVGFIGIVVALVFGLKAVDLWPNFRNPFATQTTDRSGPVLLKSIQDLSRFVAAEGNFQVLVDLQENKKYIPDIIFSERTLFVGVGAVEAYVDFSGLGDGAIAESADHKSVTINLPAPQLEKPNIDHDRSYVFAERRGIVNHVGDLFGGDPNRQQQLYQLAEQKIAEAATDSELRERAETNARKMLESMLHSLGYEQVIINFAQP